MRTLKMNAATQSPATAKLSEFDFICVVDASGSMDDVVKAGSGRTRWQAVQESAEQFARDVGKFDSDGIDVVIFSGSAVTSHTGVTADKVKEVFATRSPRGSTPLAQALTEALKLAGKSDKKDFIVVFTDGVPDDKHAAAEVIRNAANAQETDDALTILFVQVGDAREATAYLQELDDNLKGAKFDIVDAKTVDEVDAFASTTDLILAAIDG
ncbi:MAG: VWA domain-containing protein [Comamonadaceae bacterium]|nr:MAG: VWA domain-containing protein [Comamonadaceae bacterium]